MSVVVIMPAYNAAQTLEITYASIPMDVVDQVILTDDVDHPTDFRIDRHIWLQARANLLDNKLNFSARAAYRWFDSYGAERTNDVFWGTLEVAAKPWPFLQPALRYDIYLFNDQRIVGERRNPNPAMTLRLVVDMKF
jgi:hypothetical protein